MSRLLVGLALSAALSTLSTSALASGQEPRGPEPDAARGAVGIHGGTPFLRLANDRLRLYPDLALRLDATWSPRPSVSDPSLGADVAGPRVALRRVLFGLRGELFRAVAFTAELELGGQRIGSTAYLDPKRERRWAPADAHDGVVRPAEISVTATPFRALSFSVGQLALPFSLSNRTPEARSTFMERPLAIRGLAAPNDRAMGLMAWGELDDRLFAYEAGVFGGRLGTALGERNVDVAGRIFARPFARAGRGVFFELAQVGLSARLGTRHPSPDGATVDGLATGQGYVLFRPGWIDGAGRQSYAVLRGRQRAIGGELRLPFRTPTRAVFDLVAEAYAVDDETDVPTSGGTAADLLASSSRRGSLSGAAWYVSLDWWACFIPGFEQLVVGEPGVSRPTSLDDRRVPVLRSAMRASVLVGGVNATYHDGRGLGPHGSDHDVTVYQVGGTLAYLLGENVRASIEYMAYVAPHAGDRATTDVVLPQDLGGGGSPSHVTHEVGLRVGVGL
jgi:hypothetical protein